MFRKIRMTGVICLLLAVVTLCSSCYYNTVQYYPAATEETSAGDADTTAGGNDPDEPKENLCAPADAFIDYLLAADSFRIKTTGEVLASALKIRQGIDSLKLKSGSAYYYDSLASSFVEFHHFAFFENGKVAYRENNAAAKAVTLDEYRASYGVTPMDYSVEGIFLNRNTVESLDVTENADGSKVYHYVLKNVNSAAASVRVQMKLYGSLSKLPDFETMTIDLTVAEDGTPLASDLCCAYTASPALLLGIETSCTQTLHSDYSFGPVEIPDAETYRNLLN